jgi:predicted PurR-regulated permease PerM
LQTSLVTHTNGIESTQLYKKTAQILHVTAVSKPTLLRSDGWMQESVRSPRSTTQMIRQSLTVLAVSLAMIVVLVALFSVRKILLIFLVGLGIGVVIAPTFPLMRARLKIPYGVTALLHLMVFVLVLGGGTLILTNLIAYDLAPLFDRLPQTFETSFNWVIEKFGAFPVVQDHIRNFDFEFDRLIPQATQGVVAGLRFGGAALFYVLFMIAVAIYFAIDSDRYQRSFLGLFPAYLRPRARQIMNQSASTLRHWFVAQAIVMAGVAGMTAIALLVIGLDDWFLYAILAGVLNIVPYVGPFLTGGILIVVTLSTNPALTLWVVGAFFLVQQVESYLLVPMVMRGTIALPPIYLLVLIFAMGTWFGLLGIFAAPAIMAISRQILLMTYIPKMNSMRTRQT